MAKVYFINGGKFHHDSILSKELSQDIKNIDKLPLNYLFDKHSDEKYSKDYYIEFDNTTTYITQRKIIKLLKNRCKNANIFYNSTNCDGIKETIINELKLNKSIFLKIKDDVFKCDFNPFYNVYHVVFGDKNYKAYRESVIDMVLCLYDFTLILE